MSLKNPLIDTILIIIIYLSKYNTVLRYFYLVPTEKNSIFIYGVILQK